MGSENHPLVLYQLIYTQFNWVAIDLPVHSSDGLPPCEAEDEAGEQ